MEGWPLVTAMLVIPATKSALRMLEHYAFDNCERWLWVIVEVNLDVLPDHSYRKSKPGMSCFA